MKNTLLIGTAVIFVLLISISGLLLLSPFFTTYVLSQLFLNDKVELVCLDYHYNIPDSLIINDVCLHAEEADFRLSGGTFNVFDYRLNVQSLNIEHHAASQQGQKTGVVTFTELPAIARKLLAKLPRVSVEEITLQSPLLAKPLYLNLKQNAFSEFTFVTPDGTSGAINIGEQQLALRLSWTVTEVLPYFISPEHLQHLQLQSTASVESEITLQANKINSHHSLSLLTPLSMDNCDVQISADGIVSADYDLSTMKGTLNTSAVSISSAISDCPAVNDITNRSSLDFSHVAILVSGEIAFTDETLSLPEIRMSLPDSAHTHLIVAPAEIDLASPATNIQTTLEANSLSFDTFSLATISAKSDTLVNLENMHIESGTVSILVDDIQQSNVTVDAVTSEISIVGEQSGEYSLQGHSRITNTRLKRVYQPEVNLSHQITFSLDEMTLDGTHIAWLGTEEEEALTLDLKHVKNAEDHSLSINIPEQPVNRIAPLAHQLNGEISGGNIALDAEFDLLTSKGDGKLSIDELSAKFGEYTLFSLNFAPQFSLDSANLQLFPARLTINRLDAGVIIESLTAELLTEDSRFRMKEMNSQLLGGELLINNAWLDKGDQTVTLSMRGIDLQKVMNIQQEAGIESNGITLSGKIDGDIPLTIKDGNARIELASLINSTTGVLKIEGNSGFEAMKAQQPEIGQQLAFLEYVEFDTLSSDLSMDEDGLVFFDMKIRGINPEHQQPINFNYTHQQNVFTLLRSLRLADQIEKNINRKLSGNR